MRREEQLISSFRFMTVTAASWSLSDWDFYFISFLFGVFIDAFL